MLMIIYVAMKISTTLTHRELIDMIIAVKETRLLSQLENISKTKIRGILALFKQGQLFHTHDIQEGESVQLFFNESIFSFKDLREQHDSFIAQWTMANHLFIPTKLKCEILWQLDLETKALRLTELKDLEARIKHFFLSGGHIPSQTFLSSENNTTSSKSSSSSDALWKSSISSVVNDYQNLPLPTPVHAERYLNNSNRVNNYQPSGVSLPLPPFSFPSDAPSLKFPTQSLPIQREISGDHEFNNSNDPPYFSTSTPSFQIPTSSFNNKPHIVYSSINTSEFIPRNSDGVYSDFDGEMGGSYEGYDSAISPRAHTETVFPASPIPDRSPKEGSASIVDYQQQQPHQQILQSVETYYDTVSLRSIPSSDSYYHQQQSQSDYSPPQCASYSNEFYNPYDNQLKYQQHYDQYPPNSDTVYNLYQEQLQRQPINPVSGLPLVNPPIGGFMNRHYRPNRNKNKDEQNVNQNMFIDDHTDSAKNRIRTGSCDSSVNNSFKQNEKSSTSLIPTSADLLSSDELLDSIITVSAESSQANQDEKLQPD
jgi:hypothetical protein